MKRFLAALPLVFGLTTFGFGLGGGLSAELLLAPGRQGLDAAVTVAIWAIAAALTGLAVALFLAFRMSQPRLLRLGVMMLLMGASTVGFFVWRGTQRPAQSRTAE